MLTSVPSLLKQELSEMKRGTAALSKRLRGFLNHCWPGRKPCLLPQKSSLLSNASGSDESRYKSRSFLPPHLLCPGLCWSCRGSSSPASARLASGDPTVKIPVPVCSCVPCRVRAAPCPLHSLSSARTWRLGMTLRGFSRALLRSPNQVKEQDLFGFYSVNPFFAGQL